MDVLYLLIPLSVVLVFAVGAIFWWALNNRQFDDLDEVSERLLADDEDGAGSDRPPPPTT